tara:strand:+ start:143 stop:316 length:174 start_codon:yes stop_codon:yes gene_type:complete
LKKKKKKNNWVTSTSYNLPIKFIFVVTLSLSFIGCEGWSVMGYALDKSHKNNTEIDE